MENTTYKATYKGIEQLDTEEFFREVRQLHELTMDSCNMKEEESIRFKRHCPMVSVLAANHLTNQGYVAVMMAGTAQWNMCRTEKERPEPFPTYYGYVYTDVEELDEVTEDSLLPEMHCWVTALGSDNKLYVIDPLSGFQPEIYQVVREAAYPKAPEQHVSWNKEFHPPQCGVWEAMSVVNFTKETLNPIYRPNNQAALRAIRNLLVFAKNHDPQGKVIAEVKQCVQDMKSHAHTIVTVTNLRA